MNLHITYRRTSRLSVRIDRRGEVRVSAPLGSSRDEVLDFVRAHKDWIITAQQRKLKAEDSRRAFFAQLLLRTRAEKADAQERLKALILPLVEKYVPKVGVRPTIVTYSATISRWGCCRPADKEVNFSFYLLLLPAWCVESIVAHEMAHFLQANHSPAFYRVWEQLFPRWREARLEIKRISRME